MIWIITAIIVIAAYYTYKNEFEVTTKYLGAATNKKIKIGIISSWNRKGVPYQSKFLSKCLSSKYEIHIFAYKDYIEDDHSWGYSKVVFTKLIKHWKVINWIQKEDLSAVYFPDRLEDPLVLNYCRRKKIPTIMIINYETIKKQEFPLLKKYDVLMCPVKCTQDLLKRFGFKNTVFIRWAVDNTIFKPGKTFPKGALKLIHNAGFGGVDWRKNTSAVVEAFDIASRSNPEITLILKSQKPIEEYPEAMRYTIEKNKRITVNDRDLKVSELVSLYRTCHASILPSKWEGIGIPFIESLAMGLPVITVDAPPMCEWIEHGRTGLTAKIKMWEERKDNELLVHGARVDIGDLARQILRATNINMIKKMREKAIVEYRNCKAEFTKEVLKLTDKLCAK